jgi:hypothetical protein
MREVAPGDLILSFVHTQIAAIATDDTRRRKCSASSAHVPGPVLRNSRTNGLMECQPGGSDKARPEEAAVF